MRSEVLVEDEGGPLVWRAPVFHRVLAAFFGVFCVVVGVALVVHPPMRILWLAPLYLAGGIYVGAWSWRPRVAVDGSTLSVTTTVRGRRDVDVARVVGAESDYYGLTIWLDAPSSLEDGLRLASSIGGTPNPYRWFGRVSSGDVRAALILHRAAVARGEDPGPIRVEGRRGAGELRPGLVALLAALFRGGR